MFVVPFVWLAIGYLAAISFAPKATLVERIAYSLLFGIGLVPLFVVAHAFLAPAFITNTSIVVATVLAAAFFGLLAWRRRCEFCRTGPMTRWNGVALAIGVLVAAVAWRHYNDAEFVLALASYLQRGEAECFYMQTFKLVGALHPGGLRTSLREAYDIISTPGNVVFTSAFFPILGRHTFHIMYVVFQVLVFWFSYLLASAWTEKSFAALVAAAFVALSPYMLWIEVLDRNVIAFALGAALLHAAWTRDERVGFLGLLFGLCAGTGLRFLWIVGALPIALVFVVRKRSWKAFAGFAVVAAATFAFNLPHLTWHGLHTLGETTPAWKLAWDLLAHPTRTPLVPLPNAAWYGMHLLRFLGVAALALALAGCVDLKRRCNAHFTIPILVFLPISFVLATQRDWIEADKLRILVSAFPALVVWIAAGIASVMERDHLRRRWGVAFGCAIVVFAWGFFVARWDAASDESSRERKPVYQSDAVAYSEFYRGEFSRFRPWPRYAPLFDKLRWGRKRVESAIVAQTLLGKGASPRVAEHSWVRSEFADVLARPIPEMPFSGRFRSLAVDLERLATDPANAVRVAEEGTEFFLDYIDEESVLDVYHKTVPVSWQPEPLTMTVLPGKPEFHALAELPIELNAFVSYGKDEVGFERVNLIHLGAQKRGQAAFDTGLTALPQTDDRSVISVRIPAEVRVILRYWIVDSAKGTPHRIDAWAIEAADGKPEIRFFPLEPESYL
ncbi:MAG: hypothetical protein IT350_06720 [Deltaproteobacteria bacterium]|nr:hypothetical protein [Deltaproteobacteria bacterium]